MYDYEMSEQLFLDIWKQYGFPDEVDDTFTIYNILNDLIVRSKHMIVLDHYSHINFDEIIKVEYSEKTKIFKLYWLDNSKLRLDYLKNELSEMDEIKWILEGYCTYEYIAIDIDKIKFVNINGHIFILVQANMVQEKDLKNRIIGKNEVIEIENCTNELYARYVFWEGNKENLVKVNCIANNLPYYVCVIQPKENIRSSIISKKLLLIYTLQEINNRLRKVRKSLELEKLDQDGLSEKGNTIRRVMEYALKHFCVIENIPIEIEKKYGHIELGILRKRVKGIVEITQSLINVANELSHDSGKKYSIDEIKEFYFEVTKLIKDIQDSIYHKEIE